MKTLTGISPLREALAACRAAGESIGFVPTMGALHEGHLSLVRASFQRCHRTVVSIFVNPTQFGPGEDFQKYPRTLDEDLGVLEPLGVDFVFVPSVEEIYPAADATAVLPSAVSRPLEGEFRPHHFQGVATVVLKLFQIVQPHIAFFGQKDYQQSLVVRQMVRDLNVPLEVVVCPTLRGHDGLALSSRNRYLNPAERAAALSLFRSLKNVRTAIRNGVNDAQQLTRQMEQDLIAGGVTSIDYAALCDPETLQRVPSVELPIMALIACRVGATRLIDNLRIE